MEIQINKLRELLVLMKPVISKKATLQVTRYIRVGDGKAVATDLETMIIADMPEATEPMLLPFESLADMLRYVPGSTIKIDGQDKKITLAWDGGTASYPTENIGDFPILPEMETRAECLIDGDTLMPAMAAALPYVANNDNRLILNGVTMVLGNPIEVAAGDGFTMSHQVLGLSFPLEEKIIVPAHCVYVLEHVFDKTPRTPPSDVDSLISVITAKRQLHVSLIGDHKIRFDFGTTASVVINLVEGSPPEWLALIPKGEPILQSQLFAPQLEAAVKRVRNIAKDSEGIVRMVFAGDRLTVSAVSDETEITATIDTLLTQGEPGRTAFNYVYLLRYLAGKQGIITLSQYGKSSPVMFEYQTSPHVLIMPMFVKWDDDPATNEKPAEEHPDEEEPEDSPAEETGEETPEPVEAAAAAATSEISPPRKSRKKKAV